MGNTGPTSLELLSLTGTQVQDLRPLVGLTMLEILMLDATFWRRRRSVISILDSAMAIVRS